MNHTVWQTVEATV